MHFEQILLEKMSNVNYFSELRQEVNNKIIESIEMNINVQNRNQVHVRADIESVGRVHFIISVHSANQVIIFLIAESEFAKAFVESLFDEVSLRLERKGIGSHIFFDTGNCGRRPDGL